jgi:hypothetical protein
MMNHAAETLPALPLQIGFKHRLPDGRQLDSLLRRVVAGNATPIALLHDGPRHISGQGRFSDTQTLFELLTDTQLAGMDARWMHEAVTQLLAAAQEVCRYQPSLWQLFCSKGKFEYITPQAAAFATQYIPSNYTIKLHASTAQQQPSWLLHGLAQHLDYPFAAGERRFSTTRLFDCCFAAEKIIAPKGLAARIDATLEAAGVFQPHRHNVPDADHVRALLANQPAALRSGYERVLQRERFAALIAHWYGAPLRATTAPILRHYQQFVELDLMLHEQQDFKQFPTKTRDDLAQALHQPLALIFTRAHPQPAGFHDRTTRSNLSA